MANDSYIKFGDTEVINVGRTASIARAIGLDTVRIRRELVESLRARFQGAGFGLGGFGTVPFGGPVDTYADVTKTPWYDAGFPASTEFAGLVPLRIQGLDDSSLEASPSEYISDGGHTGRPRNGTQTIVASVAIVATTERGADYGARWLGRVLRGDPGDRVFCTGTDLTYFRYAPTNEEPNAPLVHRRDVRLTRGLSITRKKFSKCSSTWLATFTWTAGDPYEYGLPVAGASGVKFSGGNATGTGVTAQGTQNVVESSCAVFSYEPIYDPLYPALVPSPTAPTFLPQGWTIEDGRTFLRKWVRITAPEPSEMVYVPYIRLSAPNAARMLRVSIYPGDSATDDQCDPLASYVISYMPGSNLAFYLDGEQKAAYTWDGGPYVRRSDSLVYSKEGGPVDWSGFVPGSSYLLTLDNFDSDATVTLDLSLIPKSD